MDAIKPISRRIYVASSWRNPIYRQIVSILRQRGHKVYDFRNPPSGTAFAWHQVHEDWRTCTKRQHRALLDHPIAQAGFDSDYQAMQWADAVLLVMPCGRSAHLELGWACGQGKQTLILLDDHSEPELMIKMVDHICTSMSEVLRHLAPGQCVDCCGSGADLFAGTDDGPRCIDCHIEYTRFP